MPYSEKQIAEWVEDTWLSLPFASRWDDDGGRAAGTEALSECARTLIAAVRKETREKCARVLQEISERFRQSALNARHRGDERKYASIHRKRNGIVACIAAIRNLQEREEG